MMPTRLLIVDDEPPMRSALRTVFEEAGFEVAAVDSAAKAVSRMAEESFDLLILDKNLPGESGVDLLRRLRQQGNDVCVLLMTAYVTAQSVQDTLNLGVDGYLEKPFPDIFEVVEIAKAALERRRTSRDVGEGRSAGIRMLPPPQDPERSSEAPFVAERPSQPLHVVIACREHGRAELARPIGKAGNIVFAAEEPDALAAIAAHRPDLLVLDATSFSRNLCEIVESLRRAAPMAVCVVVTTAPLTVPVLRGLVQLGVKGLFEPETYPAALRDILGQLEALQVGSP